MTGLLILLSNTNNAKMFGEIEVDAMQTGYY